MLRTFIITGIAAATLAACSEKADVHGQTNSYSETFSGVAKNCDSKRGKLMLDSSRGVTCGGDFTHKSEHVAIGTMNCSDGRAGTFTLNSDSHGGSGSGVLNNEPFTFGFSEQ
jgi:hypothetical protein